MSRITPVVLAFFFLSLGQLVKAYAASDDLWVPPRIYERSNRPKTGNADDDGLLLSSQSPRQGAHIQLESLSLARLEELLVRPSLGPDKIGFPRDVKALSSPAQVSDGMDWVEGPGGVLIGHINIQSPGAAALRLGLRFQKLPDSAEFRFHNSDLKQVEKITAKEIQDILTLNKVSREVSPDATTYWSPVMTGESIGLEVTLPQGLSADAMSFTVEAISHLSINPGQSDLSALQPRAAASCNLDSRCYSNWSPTTNAVARIVFTSGGSSYLCTGTLLNDTSSSNTPYFLTANHCISSQTSASTITSYWFYYSSSCNSGTIFSGTSSMSGGGTLLYNSSTTDASFLKLNGTLPSGVTFSGWTNSTPSLGVAATGLHNPTGDLQKISFWLTSDYETCQSASSSTFTCSSSNASSGTFINVSQVSGTTEGGSSGSGIFLDNNQYLFGQLYGGNASCTNTKGSTVYGLFSKTYTNGNLGQWLATGKQAQTVTLAVAPSSIAVNQTATATASASSGLTVTLASTTPSVCTLSGTTVTGVSPGTCTVSATQAGSTSYDSATSSTSITVTKANQTVSVSVAPSTIAVNQTSTATASASSGLTVTLASTTPSVCTLSGTTVTGLSSGTCTVSATQAGNTSYDSSTSSSSITVTKANQTVSVFVAPSTIAVNQTATATASASSGLTVTLATTTPTVCSVSGSTVTGISPGTCTLNGGQAGNNSYNSATSNASITITKANQTVSLSIPPILAWGAASTLSATSSAGLSLTIASTTPEICLISASSTLLGLYPGTCSIEAKQLGNALYNSATTQSSATITLPEYSDPTRNLIVQVFGNGAVRSVPIGISCGAYCTLGFTKNSFVTLTAAAGDGQIFSGWSGACSGKKPTCKLKMTGNKLVRAKFN